MREVRRRKKKDGVKEGGGGERWVWEVSEDQGRREGRGGAKARNEGDGTSVAEKEGRRGTENERKRARAWEREKEEETEEYAWVERGGRKGERRVRGVDGRERQSRMCAWREGERTRRAGEAGNVEGK